MTRLGCFSPVDGEVWRTGSSSCSAAQSRARQQRTERPWATSFCLAPEFPEYTMHRVWLMRRSRRRSGDWQDRSGRSKRRPLYLSFVPVSSMRRESYSFTGPNVGARSSHVRARLYLARRISKDSQDWRPRAVAGRCVETDVVHPSLRRLLQTILPLHQLVMRP